MATSPGTFTGFRREAIQFLADLAVNNDRSWFQPRKADYERLLKEPLEALCVALSQRFEARGIPLAADPARSPFRIYRDVRFSKDKSPYKTNVGAGFAWTERRAPGEDIRGGAGGYFHFQPGEIYVGGGMWHPEPTRLAAWRALVAGDPARVHAAIGNPAFVAEFGAVNGERLKRVPAGYPPDHPEAELLRLKDIVFGRSLSDAEALSADLPDTLATALEAAVPVLRLLATLPA
jgi:uncharacterized protein (TIGR02453 family)